MDPNQNAGHPRELEKLMNRYSGSLYERRKAIPMAIDLLVCASQSSVN